MTLCKVSGGRYLKRRGKLVFNTLYQAGSPGRLRALLEHVLTRVSSYHRNLEHAVLELTSPKRSHPKWKLTFSLRASDPNPKAVKLPSVRKLH